MQLNLTRGQVLTNQKLAQTFGVSTQGGMRRSKRNHCLVLISKTVANPYPDKWQGDVLHYVGMGRTGDQSLMTAQNRTLNEANDYDVAIYLFSYTGPNHYIYEGPVELVATPYYQQQPDINGQKRRVAVFPIAVTAKA
ncbi:hypothetical protein [Lactiplantibacillus daowaiensis]|uniref:ScoMcrA-like SRA domain-containing protein n=1 Tax=Lactiplantibacillus daowaiensis TaxID=2559918 RepID=A0ABW1S2S3_9LACO